MQQAERADSTAGTVASGGKFDSFTARPIDLLSQALWDQERKIFEIDAVGGMIRVAALAIEGIGDMNGVEPGVKRALTDVCLMLGAVDTQLEHVSHEIDALHDIAFRNTNLLKGAS